MNNEQSPDDRTPSEPKKEDSAVERGKSAIEAEKITNPDVNKETQDKDAEQWRNEG